MRESEFIRLNKDKWREFEYASNDGFDDPEKLSDLFVQVTDDLSYSRTFYPNRSVRVYLNTLAQRIFSGVFKYKKYRRGALIHFWRETLPGLVFSSRYELLLALVIMICSVVIGAFSQSNNPDFILSVLGDSYVSMTKENIASGDPMAVYKEAGAFSMFLGITLNNIWVSFLTFIMGIFFGIGTIGMLIRTGVMIGAFHAFFLSEGYLAESLLAVWLHGTLEISAITLAGGAGLTMGRGLLFPGTYSRLQAFQMSSRRGISIMLGITPVLILAGFIEGFLTRFTDAPTVLRLLVILLSLGFIVGYYAIYPYLLAKRREGEFSWKDAVPVDRTLTVELDQPKSGGNLFSDTFLMVKKYLSVYLWTAGGGAIAYVGLLMAANPDFLLEYAYPQYIFSTLIYLKQYFIQQNIVFLPLLNIMIWSTMGVVVWRIFEKESGEIQVSVRFSTGLFAALKGIIPLIIIYVCLTSMPVVTAYIVFSLVLVPTLMWWFIQLKERISPLSAIRRTFFLLKGGWGSGMLVYFLLLLTGLLSLCIIDWSAGAMIVHSIGVGLGAGNDHYLYFMMLMTFLVYGCCLFLFLLGFTAAALLYYSQTEVNEAKGLQRHIGRIAEGNQIQGMAKE